MVVSISDLGIDLNTYKGFLGDSVVKNLPANAGDVSSILFLLYILIKKNFKVIYLLHLVACGIVVP